MTSLFGGGGGGGSSDSGTDFTTPQFNYNPPDPVTLPAIPAPPAAAPPTPTYGSSSVQTAAFADITQDPRFLTQKGTILTGGNWQGADVVGPRSGLGDQTDPTLQKKVAMGR